MYRALKITVTGNVQGVGFRPYVYSLSKKFNLSGTVQNKRDRVTIIIEGLEHHLVKMVRELKQSPPRLSKINEIKIDRIEPKGYKEFTIIHSDKSGDSIPWIPADAAICEQCLSEMKDPVNRRYRYPFINCTQCGPRYSIIQRLPYDRPFTTMKEFTMCPHCLKEYEDPANRRYHAQPTCCSVCGPTITLRAKTGEIVAENEHAIALTIKLLKKGKILGIKGIGGYHLACDAYQEKAVGKIRQRKKRPQRPLAIMANSILTARRLSHISPLEEELLCSKEMPIVILNKKQNDRLADNVSPGLSTIGIMLPYTPLHHLLFMESDLECLVMTSANPSGLPIQYKDESIDDLQQICDYVLMHDRQVHFPIDDSVVQYDDNKIVYLRRGRGFTPEPYKTSSNVKDIIALGGNQKNTFAVGKENYIVLGPHIGDLTNEEMIQYFEKQLVHYKDWIGVTEKYVAVDKHPFYETMSIAKRLKSKIIQVQHHHAHHVSCMEDNSLEAPCFGIILDGTGYGEDGHIWGFEFLYGNAASFERLGHLRYSPLPGGEKAVKEPWRNAVGMILYNWSTEGKDLARQLFPEKTKEIDMIGGMINNQINTPMAGTCGRLFDAVSAILGICLISTYEGEAAIKLADYLSKKNEYEDHEEVYPFHIIKNNQQIQLDLSSMLYQIIQEKNQQKSIVNIIHKFHRTIVRCCLEMVLTLVKNRPELNRTVVLSGGAFQNNYLAKEIHRQLQQNGFHVYTHNKVPCHDGGLAYGQMIVAANAMTKNYPENKER